MTYCNYQCKQDKFLDQKKQIFQKKLDQYYNKYAQHLRELKAVANKPNPHNEMARIKRTNEPALKRYENEINSILNSIKWIRENNYLLFSYNCFIFGLSSILVILFIISVIDKST